MKKIILLILLISFLVRCGNSPKKQKSGNQIALFTAMHFNTEHINITAANKFFWSKWQIVCIIISLGLNYSSMCQENSSEHKISILPVPTFGYAPETKAYIGAVTLFTFKNLNDTLTRTSNAKVEFTYTWNKQTVFQSDWNYFTEEEKWFFRGLAHFSKYPDLYYGIGPNTSAKNENVKPNAGIGLRFLVDKSENMNLRLDYAIGKNNQSGFYISFGEPF